MDSQIYFNVCCGLILMTIDACNSIVFRLQEEYKTELQSQISQIESEHQRDKDLEMKLACSMEEIQKLVQEKNDLQDQLAFQKEEILAEYEQEQCELKNELESTLVGTESAIKQLEKEKVQLSTKIGDMSKQFELEKLKIQEDFERDLQKQENEYRRDLQDFENIFAQVKYCCYINIHDNLTDFSNYDPNLFEQQKLHLIW